VNATLAATATRVDYARERDLARLAARDGWTELGAGRLVMVARGPLVAQVWWNRVARRYEWDILLVGKGPPGRPTRDLPDGQADTAQAALAAATAALVAPSLLVRVRRDGAR
jgi:hypothetical protein